MGKSRVGIGSILWRQITMTGRYLDAEKTGLLQEKIIQAENELAECTLCPRKCGVDRRAGKRGYCGIGGLAEVASYGPHFGEESVLVGDKGSGTIFFCGCNLLCCFCQNYEISHCSEGECTSVNEYELAAIMLELQAKGCHNINLVTPSHVVPQILAALPRAISGGLHIPLVYNCGGYESVETLHLLEGIVDIYMPDVKFWYKESAVQCAEAPDYRQRVQDGLLEMQRQVGDLWVNSEGVAERGLLVRHLLMPGGLEESTAIFKYLAEHISKNCYLNIMDQYRPCGEALVISGLEKTITVEQYQQAITSAKENGLTQLDKREPLLLYEKLIIKE